MHEMKKLHFPEGFQVVEDCIIGQPSEKWWSGGSFSSVARASGEEQSTGVEKMM